jgi:hypothetical protein
MPCKIKTRLSKHALDAGDSAAILSSFLRLSPFLLGGGPPSAPAPVTRAVGGLANKIKIMTNKEEQDKKDQKKIVFSKTNLPAFPPESLKNLLMTSEQIQRLVEESERFFGPFSIAIEEQEKMAKLFSQFKVPLELENISAVSQSIEKLLTLEKSQISQNFEKMLAQSDVWKEQQLAISKMAEAFQTNEKIWQSHMLEISKFAVISQATLAKIPWDEIGSALQLHTKMQNGLKKSFGNFSDAYVKLFDSLETRPEVILSFPPTITRLPAVEFYNGVSVVDAITLPEEPDIESEIGSKEFLDEARKENDDRLILLLSEIDANLIIPLQGARLSLTSTNPDRARHFATSLRELFTHVVHALAPDHEVKAWSNMPEHFEKGRATRRARLLYICRGLNQDRFSEFVEKDITAVLAFLQLFQRGTHQVVAEYSDLQLRMMLVRMESSIRFLLEIWRAGA